MSSKDQSEEKSLPASEKKLKDSRKKGQVSHSKDMVIGTGTVATLAYLWLAWDNLQAKFATLLIIPAESYGMPFIQAAEQVMTSTFDLAVITVAPLIAIIIVTSILTNVAVTQGFVFSTEPIKPKGEKINPVSGFKRIFSLKNFVELIKSLLKTLLLTTAAVILVALGLETLIKGPICGADCVAYAFGSLVKPLFIAFALIFLLFALLDVGLQRWLFLRDQRMTKTEFKRERKDMEGDPTFRQERMRMRRELAEGVSVRPGVQYATLILSDNQEAVVGLRYVQGETPVPAVVCKGRKDRAIDLINTAHQRHLPVIEDRDLTQAILRTSAIGDFVDQAHFHQVAAILVRAGQT